jgi:DNA uptake protein ComE-like DNA-binding protein
VLVIVLVVVSLLSLAAYTFSQSMLAERMAARLFVRQGQARALAESGVDLVRLFLEQEAETIVQSGGLHDNPSYFRARLVADGGTARNRGRFSLVAPKWEGDQITGIRYGIENESAKLNLNMVMAAEKNKSGAGRKILMKLPGMTQDIADAILDWMDEDEETRDQGAEANEYSAAALPYLPRNGVLGSIEELLAVRGVTTGLLFGTDANRNGIVDGSETAGTSFGEADNSDGSMNSGWAAYLTLVSSEANTQADGSEKININSKDLQSLHDKLEQALSADWANFIILYRQNGEGSGGNASSPSTATIDYSKAAKNNINSILDLVGIKVSVTTGSGRDKVTKIYESPLRNDQGTLASQLPQLMAVLTTSSAKSIPGRININLAPKVVLGTIPGITSQQVDNIISQRATDPTIDTTESRQYATWILCEGLVSLSEMKAIEPYITAGGSIYRVQAVGYFDQGGPSARIEAILDTTTQPARVLFWKDVTHLGRGFGVDVLGTE